MSMTEILWRVSMLVKKKYWKLLRPDHDRSIDWGKKSDHLQLHKPDDNDESVQNIVLEADRYLNHEWLFFGLENCREDKIDWHKDPASGISAPIGFGFDINHRDENLVGNIKYTWEKNRHHHLTILAEAFYITKDEKYAREVESQLKSWIEDNPYMMGVNWTHPLEQGIRLISWVFIYEFLKESKYFDAIFGENGFIWKSVYQHQRFIIETYSRGSSANNHLIGEMSGLLLACFAWPVFKESRTWQKTGMQIIERELKAQTYDDGVNKELAFSYQIFVFEFCILPLLLRPDAFSEDYKGLLRKMSGVMYALTNIMGSIPTYGDGDEGMALQIQHTDADRLQWLLEMSNHLLDTNFPVGVKSVPGKLFNIANKNEIMANVEDENNFISKQAGLYAFKKNIAGKQISAMFDFGPLGLGSMAAHGHADALSFILAVDNQMVLVDPGTYCYHTDLDMRWYFRSVQSHNTLSVDGLDQSEQAGPFLWKNKAEVKLIDLNADTGTIEAEHDGYKELGIVHKRKIGLTEVGLACHDSVSGSGQKNIELRFHLHPGFEPEINGHEIIVSNGSQGIKLITDPRFTIKTLVGVENGGWYSTKFGIKQPCNTLVINGDLSLPAQIETNIEILK